VGWGVAYSRCPSSQTKGEIKNSLRWKVLTHVKTCGIWHEISSSLKGVNDSK
jgi:hypothetical protein